MHPETFQILLHVGPNHLFSKEYLLTRYFILEMTLLR